MYDFSPQPGVDVTPNPDGSTQQKLAEQWRQFLSNDATRAALMQFGAVLSQPPGFAQNTLGQIGQAFGSGGEAAGRVLANERLDQEMARKERETSSREDLRAAQATAAEARAGTAAIRADASTERLAASRENAQLSANVKLMSQYNKYVENARIMAPDKPVLTFNEWTTMNPNLVKALGGGTTATAGQSVPQAPSNPAERVPGTTYQTPRGPLKWQGQGWESK